MCLVNNILKFDLSSASIVHQLFFFLIGVGRTAPDPSAAVTLDGVQVPLGKGAHTNIDDTSLLYNEYPLTLTIWFENLIIILTNDPTFFLLFFWGKSLHNLSIFFLILNKRHDI